MVPPGEIDLEPATCTKAFAGDELIEGVIIMIGNLRAGTLVRKKNPAARVDVPPDFNHVPWNYRQWG